MTSDDAAAIAAAFFRPGTQVPAFICADMMRTDGRAREALWQSLGEGNYTDEVMVAASFDKPLAIVHGEKEPLVSLQYLKGLSIPTLWRGEIQVISDAGHTPHWEQPDTFNDLLMVFIENCGNCTRL